MAGQQERFCAKCGHAAQGGERFCVNCGNGLINKRENRRSARPKFSLGKGKNWVWVSATAVVLVFVGALIVTGLDSGKKKNIARSHNVALVREIISEFNCNCGTCDKTLANCDCPTAIEENKYIEDAVATAQYTRKEIIEMVSRRYGGLINKDALKG